MNYTLHQLEIFRKIAEVKSVTKASEELFLTQPAVSIQLKNFQDQFKLPLFEIVGRKLYITEFGAEIAVAATKILDEVEAISYKSALFEGQLAGKLKIAIVSTAKYAMPYFLSGFVKANEMVDVIMDVTNKTSVIKSLENNDCDFAMVSTIPKKLKINRIELMENKLFLVAKKGYFQKNKPVQKKDLESFLFIFREKGSATRLAMENYLLKNNIKVSRKMELTSNEAIKQAILAGLGVSIMSLIGLRNSLQTDDVEIIPLDKLPIITNWNLIWLRSKNLSTVARAFKEHIEKHKELIIKENFEWYNNY